ncbi:hypothetical protein Droror1_Dr00026876, partial [Drosera rotundifolia]
PPFTAAGPIRRCWSRRRLLESPPLESPSPVAAARVAAAAAGVAAAAAWSRRRCRLEESPPQH